MGLEQIRGETRPLSPHPSTPPSPVQTGTCHSRTLRARTVFGKFAVLNNSEEDITYVVALAVPHWKCA
jgi:hypothetical protein